MKSKHTTKKRTGKQHQHTRLPFWRPNKRLWQWVGGIVGALVFLLGAAWLFSQLSPWPSALFIRYEFDKNGTKVSEALEKHVPQGITQVENQQYRSNDDDAFLDVFYPEKTSTQLPAVVWVHGGAWVSGNKDEVDNYLKILASYGFTVIGVNYSIAPEKQYPTPLLQVNDALGYIQQHAKRLNIDDSRVVLAGDSAGSQIVAQIANGITNTAYANEIGIQPTLPANQLKGLLLNCGAYDLALADYNGPFGGFLRTVLWSYSGTKDFLHAPKLKPASVINYLTSDFPPSFITAGNVDPLLSQSTELAQKLRSLGVPTSALFYPENHQPALSHEYQFDLDNDDGKRALAQMVGFLRQHMK